MKRRHMARKVMSLLMCAALVALLAACGGTGGTSSGGGTASGTAGASGSGAAGEAATLNVIMPADVPNLDPNNDDNVTHYQVTRQIYEPLFSYDADYNIIPWLCESYEYEDDNTLVVKLREGVKFHNGDELKASDVLFTFRRIIDESLASLQQVQSLDIDKCEVVDDYTVKLVTASPAPTLLALLQHPGTGIISESDYTAAGGDFSGGKVAGTGPFVFESYTPGDNIQMGAFADYWRDGEPGVGHLSIRFITDSTARAVEAETGADIVYDIAASDIETVESSNGVSIARDLGTYTLQLMLNTSQAPLDDIRVRQAISYAIDVESAVKTGFPNFGEVASGWVAPGILGYDDALVLPQQNIEEAKALLAEAGYPNGLTLSVCTYNNQQERMNVCEAMQAQLAQVGITLTIDVMDTTAMASFTTEAQHQMTIQGFSCTDFEADRALGQFMPGAYYFGLFSFENDELTALYNKSIETMDRAEREQTYKDAIDIVMENYITIPLWHRENNAAVNDSVQGFRIDRALSVHELQTVTKA